MIMIMAVSDDDHNDDDDNGDNYNGDNIYYSLRTKT